ncbi:MAG: hypothetical protein ACREA2_11730 [Blastocatellia bacterium]
MSNGRFFSDCDPWFDRRFIDAWLRWGGGIEGGPVGVRGLAVAKQLEGLVPGDTRELIVFPIIPSLRDGVSRQVVSAWLTIKDDEGDLDAAENVPWSASGARQKITTTNNPGFGQILDQVSPELRFDLKSTNTAFLTGRRTYYFDCRIEMSDGAKYSVEVGNFTIGQPVALPQGAQMSILRTIHRNTTVVGNVGGGLDGLHSASVPAASLKSNGDYLRVWLSGEFAANNNNKQIRISFGGQVLIDTGQVDFDSGDWAYEVVLTRLTSTTVRVSIINSAGSINFLDAVVSGSGSVGAGNSVITVSDLAVNALILLVEAQGVADNDVTQNLSIIELSQA